MNETRSNLGRESVNPCTDFSTIDSCGPVASALILERYTILREISRGGQAVVFEAIQKSTGRKVAIKVSRAGAWASASERARFDREVQILAALDHPHIVRIIDRGCTSDGALFLVLDFVAGKSLNQFLETYYQKLPEGPPPEDPSELLRLFLKICDAVNAAHLRGIVHRDLKPSNIRIDEQGEPRVLDFGLARAGLGTLIEDGEASPHPLTMTGQFLGSLPWASPEQAEGANDKIDVRSDVYSLGVLLYQMMTRRFPYGVDGSMRDVLNNIIGTEPTPPSQAIRARDAARAHRKRRWYSLPSRTLDPGLDGIILKALAKRREDRYQSAGELGRSISNHLSGRTASAAAGALRLSIRARRWVASVALLIVVTLIVAGIVPRRWFSAERGQSPSSLPSNPTPATAPSPAGGGARIVAAALVGKTQPAARRILREQGIAHVVVARPDAPRVEVPMDLPCFVLAQEPAAGATIDRQETVTLHVWRKIRVQNKATVTFDDSNSGDVLVNIDARGELTFTPLNGCRIARAVAPAVMAGVGLAHDGDERIIAAGADGDGKLLLERYTADGALDMAFGSAGIVRTRIAAVRSATSLAVQRDGKIVAIGQQDGDFAVARFQADGSIDKIVSTDFDGGPDGPAAVVLQADDKIVVAGTAVHRRANGTDEDFAVVRYTPDLEPDKNFGNGGKVMVDFSIGADRCSGVLVLPSGGIVVTGTAYVAPRTLNFAFAQFLSDGSLPQVAPVASYDFFRGSDWGSAVVQVRPGVVVIGGTVESQNLETQSDFGFAWMNLLAPEYPYFRDLGKSATDLGGGSDILYALAVQPGQKLVAMGSCEHRGRPAQFAMARYNFDGSLDKTFGVDGKVLGTESLSPWLPGGLAIRRDGKIMVAGMAAGRFVMWRYDADGSTDDTFAISSSRQHDWFGMHDPFTADSLHVAAGAYCCVLNTRRNRALLYVHRAAGVNDGQLEISYLVWPDDATKR